jgi:hypothetical protein
MRDGEPKAIQFGFAELATKAGISQDMGKSQDILFKVVIE